MLTREQTIAHLEVHGYRPYIDRWGWHAVWSEALKCGCMCRWLAESQSYDTRKTYSDLAVRTFVEVSWRDMPDRYLTVLAGESVPTC